MSSLSFVLNGLTRTGTRTADSRLSRKILMILDTIQVLN